MSWLNAANLQTFFLDAKTLAARKLKRERCGEVGITSGRVVVCDPATDPSRTPLARGVACGRFPVEMMVDSATVALAAILFCDPAQVDLGTLRWEMAMWPKQDASTLGADEFFGYPVGAGLGCYMDADAAAWIDAHGGEFDEHFNAVLSAELDTASYAVYQSGEGAANCVMFRSGYGDGMYPSYWAFDRNGVAIALITDFMTLEDGDARNAHERARDAYVASLAPAELESLEALGAAVENNDLAKVAQIIAAGQSVNAIIPSSGETAILQAIRQDRTDVLRLLLGTPPRCPEMPEQTRIPAFTTYLGYALFLRTPRDLGMIALLREASPTLPA